MGISSNRRDSPWAEVSRNRWPGSPPLERAGRVPRLFPEEAYLSLPRGQRERQRRVDRLAENLQRGPDTLTVELGCRAGQMTRFLQHAMGGRVVGVEKDREAIRAPRDAGCDNPHVEWHKGGSLDWCPNELAGCVDQVVASYLLHEVFSAFGKRGLDAALEKCHRLLRPGDRLIVADGLSPPAAALTVRFRDTSTLAQLHAFRNSYTAAPVDFRFVGDMACVIGSAVLARFLNSLKFLGPSDLGRYASTLEVLSGPRQQAARAYYLVEYYTWPQAEYAGEFTQDFAFFTAEQWSAAEHAAGLGLCRLQDFNERCTEEAFWQSRVETEQTASAPPKIHVLIVVEKDGKDDWEPRVQGRGETC